MDWYAVVMRLVFEDLCQRYGGATVLDIPSLVIEAGEFFTFSGSQGCGKSTALKLIAGLEVPSVGSLMAGGRACADLQLRDREIVVIDQIDQIDVLDPGTHKVVVLDEPLSGLDESQRALMGEKLRRTQAGSGTTVVYATSDSREALRLSDRLAILDGGRLRQVGTPRDLLDDPRHTAVAGFLGDPPMNIVPGILEKDGVAVEIGPRAVPLNGTIAETYARDVFLGVRPEHVRLRPDPASGWRGTVIRVESRRERTTVEVQVDGGRLVAREDTRRPYQIGDRVAVAIEPLHLYVFDDRGDRLDVV